MANSNIEIEKITTRKYILPLILVAFLIIYFIPELGLTEFRWKKEGLYTAIAMEMEDRKSVV